MEANILRKFQLNNATIFLTIIFCIVVFVILKILESIIFTTIIEDHLISYVAQYQYIKDNDNLQAFKHLLSQYSAPVSANIINLVFQGIIFFSIGYLIDIKIGCFRGFRLILLFLVLFASNITSSIYFYIPNYMQRVLFILITMIVCIASTYLAIYLKKKRVTQ